MANSGYGTRSQIRKLIRSGNVSVGGSVIKDPSTDILAGQLSGVLVSGKELDYSEFIYLCLNKPDRFLTARKDTRLPTVQRFIPENLRGKGISPVGRLDYHTTGVLLLTNDGELSHRLTSPKRHLPKSYTVTYSGPPVGTAEIERFAAGFILTDRPEKQTVLMPAQLCSINDTECSLTLFEGKTHQVRRMMAATGRIVIGLHRHDFAGIRLGPTQEFGEIRELSREEIRRLRSDCGLPVRF
ncbi:MAG: rRNA pseudouridine synthase [Clostridiales bacterium]|nr:rRNA pseudouridine synthase [Clostridiales bacterium]